MISLSNDFSKLYSESSFGTFNNTYSQDLKTAVLYLISPRQIADTTVRPYAYKFDGEFLQDLSDTVDRAKDQAFGSIGGNYRLSAFMQGYRSPNQALLPQANGLRFFGQPYGQLWTFILIIDNPPILGRNRQVNLSGRLIYTGFCMEEPVSELFGNISFNDNCPLLVTHMTRLHVNDIVDTTGRVMSVQPMEDIDIVSPSIVMSSSPDRQYYLRPEDLVNTSGITGDGNSWDMPARSSLQFSPNIASIDTSIKSPKFQLSKIVDALAKTVIQTEESRYISPNVADVPVYMMDSAATYECFKNNLVTRLPDRICGLNVNDQIFLGEVLSQYPVLRNTTQILGVPRDLPTSPMDDTAPNPVNVMTALLTSSIPPIMSQYGLSDVSFRYVSRDPSKMTIFANEKPSCCEVLGGPESFIIGEPTDIIRLRWFKALEHLENHIFPIIIDNFGNFEVLIGYKSSGECIVQLQLPDMYIAPNHDFHYTNGMCGGLQTPLIGDLATRSSNVSELESAFEVVTNSSRVGFGTY